KIGKAKTVDRERANEPAEDDDRHWGDDLVPEAIGHKQEWQQTNGRRAARRQDGSYAIPYSAQHAIQIQLLSQSLGASLEGADQRDAIAHAEREKGEEAGVRTDCQVPA